MPASKQDNPQPTLMKGRKPIDIGLDDLISILSMINSHRQQAKLVQLAKTDGLTVSVSPKTVNAVKAFIAAHPKMREHDIGKQVMYPAKAKGKGKAVLMASADAGGGNDSCCGFSPGG